MPWLTTEEAAEILEYHPETIREMLRDGRLKGKKHGYLWLVNPDSVDDFKSWIMKHGFEKHDPRRGTLK
jgi:excisionase family DNA binding protein